MTTDNPRYLDFLDNRCMSPDCRTKNVYRMVGHCLNCGTENLLVLNTAGHTVSTPPHGPPCPRCGCWTVVQDRLALEDELPGVPNAG